MPSAIPRCCCTKSSRRSQTPSFDQRRKVCAAFHHGPSSAGTLRHLAPFWCRQKIAEIVRRRCRSAVFPCGRCDISRPAIDQFSLSALAPVARKSYFAKSSAAFVSTA